MNSWFVYVLRCKDNTLYTGITTNLKRRLQEHNTSNRGAKYTRSRRPCGLVFSRGPLSRSTAASLEYKIKKLRKKEKEKMIAGSDDIIATIFHSGSSY